MERLPTWVTLFCLSIVIIAALVNQFPQREARENYSLATAIISLLFSFFFVVANLVDGLGAKVVGNVFENGKFGIIPVPVLVQDRTGQDRTGHDGGNNRE